MYGFGKGIVRTQRVLVKGVGVGCGFRVQTVNNWVLDALGHSTGRLSSGCRYLGPWGFGSP